MSFAVGGPGKPANGAMAEALLEIIRSVRRRPGAGPVGRSRDHARRRDRRWPDVSGS